MQAREGQRVRGPNGEIGVFRNGRVEVISAQPRPSGVPEMIVPPQPRQPAPQTVDQATIDAARAAQAPHDISRAATDAARSGIELERLQQGGGNTEGQSRAAAFLRNALRSAREYERLGIGPEPFTTSIGNAISRDLMNNLPPPVGNSPEREQAYQHMLGFTNAMLRFESGANAPEAEVERYIEQYFPGSGASPEAIETARRARARGVEAMLSAAGPAVPAELRAEAEQWLGNRESGRQPGYDRSPTGEAVEYRPGDEAGAFSTERDLETAATVRQMIRSNRSAGEVASYVRGRGYSVDISSITEAVKAQRENRSWTVTPPESGSHTPTVLNRVANSPFGAAVVASADTLTGGHLDNLVGLTGGDTDRANYDMEQLRERHPGASLAGDIAGGASIYGIGRSAVSRFAPRLLEGASAALRPAAIAGDAATGAYVGSGTGTTDPFSVSGALRGSALATPLGITGRGTLNTLGRVASPSGGELAPLYREGVQPTIGQRIGGGVDRVEQAFTSVPIAGGVQRRARNAAVEQFQAGAFNQALREIGQELPEGVRSGAKAHRFMQRAFNNEFRDVRRQMRFTPDEQFGQEFGQLQQGLMELGDDSRRIFERMVRNQVGNRIRRSGSLSGDDYLKAASRFDARARQLRRSPNGDTDLADALESFSTMLDDAAIRQAAPELGNRLAAARSGYRRAVVIEDAARRRGGAAGEFSPKQLDAAVQNIGGGLRSRAYLRGDAPMQEYATAGLRLGDNLPNSGTADRFLSSGAPWVVGGVGAGYVNPLLLSPWAASTIATAPGVRQGVNALLAPNRQQFDPIREALIRRAHYPSLAVPALVAETQ